MECLAQVVSSFSTDVRTGLPACADAERYDALESDDEDEWVRGPGDDDNDDDHDDDKDNSGDGKRDQEIREG